MFKVDSINKSFKDKAVLKAVSFTIEKGDKIALLGGNGAGKTTLLKIISGQIHADFGEISTRLDYQTEVGMMPQGDVLIDDLKVSDLVTLKAKMNQLSLTSIADVLSQVSLQNFKNYSVGDLSGGQKRRLSLLLTILNLPKLIFLDEPTTGMDLESVDNFWNLLENDAFTSLIVTHDFNQIDRFFTKVFILKNGEIVADKSVAAIHESGKTIEQYYRQNIEKEKQL